MNQLNFWKMHGLGNDYIILDNREGKLKEEKLTDLAKLLCKRRFSIGADGLLLLHNSSKADVKMRIFNADGSEAEMCGNGIRCLARYCYENKIVSCLDFVVETLSGLKEVMLEIKNQKVGCITVNMGEPILERTIIPVVGDGRFINENLKVDGEIYKATCLSIGNPHCIIFVDDVDRFPVRKVGYMIERHPIFPNRTNVEFAQLLSEREMKLRVWERGVGETLACGTGACAAVTAARLLKKVGDYCTVHLKGGSLKIRYKNDHILMTGEAEITYKGSVLT